MATFRDLHRKYRTKLWIMSLAGTVIAYVIAKLYGVESPTYLTLYCINSMICVWNMFTRRIGDFTLAKFVNLFIYIFFILSNAIQFGTGNNVLTFGLMFQSEDYEFFQMVVFLILSTYNSLYVVWSGSKTRRIVRSARTSIGKSGVYTFKLVILSIIATVIVLVYLQFSYEALFLRGAFTDLLYDSGLNESTAKTLLFDKIIRSAPICCFIISLTEKVNNWIRLFLGMLALLTVFPTGIARNAAAMYWVPVMIIMMGRVLKGNRLMFAIIAGIFIVFPFFDAFRSVDIETTDEGMLEYLNTMNYDASQLFMAAYLTETITWGNQLLGAVFFFVPRSIWAAKAVGSGHYLTSIHGASFFNVSMPWFAEGYMNFGWVGVFLFTVLLSYITGRLDISFWRNKKPGKWTYSSGYYLILLGAIIFIMRGDLMSSLAYTVGTLASYWLCTMIVKKHRYTMVHYFKALNS